MGLAHQRLVSPCHSFHILAEVSIWSAEPTMLTNYAWASKIRPGRPQCLLSFGRMKDACGLRKWCKLLVLKFYWSPA